TGPQERHACYRATGAYDADAVAVANAGPIGGPRMNLHQAQTVHLLAGVGPLGHPCKVDDAGPADHAHQWVLLVHLAVRKDADLHLWRQRLRVDRVLHQLRQVFDRRILSGDFRVRVKGWQSGMPGSRQSLVEGRREDLDLSARREEALALVR